MGRKRHLLSASCFAQTSLSHTWPTYTYNKIRVFVILLLLSFTGSQLHAQIFAGIVANGKRIGLGDTINVCLGGKVVYENMAQGYTSINWRFKNGTPLSSSSTTSVSVVYKKEGIDSTIQYVKSSLERDSMYIFVKVVDNKPTASFNFSPNNQCGNIPILFTNGSFSDTSLSYLWVFGDGGTSTEKDPSYQFLDAIGTNGIQNYPVKLVATNSYNCADSISKTITVRKVPDASIGTGNKSADVAFSTFNDYPTFKHCQNVASFVFRFTNQTTTSSINTKYTIKWGDGTPDSVFTKWLTTDTIPHRYSIGQHQVTILVNGSNGCIGIKTFDVFIGTNPAGTIGNLGNNNICAPNFQNFVITGYNINNNGTTYTVSVNDGTQPRVFSHPPPDTISHLFSIGSCGIRSGNGTVNYPNAYRVGMMVENPCGTNSSIVLPIHVSGIPKANITMLPGEVACVNSEVTFNNSSSWGGVIKTQGPINSICTNTGKQVWQVTPATGYTVTSGTFGSINNAPTDQTRWTSGTGTFSAKFTTPGVYRVIIFVANERCGFDSISKTICIRLAPEASFTTDKKRVCGVDTVAFTNTSPVGGCLGETYNWSIAYKDSLMCSDSAKYQFVGGTTADSANPRISFENPGVYVVTLSVNATGAYTACSTAVARDTIVVMGKPKVFISPPDTICSRSLIRPFADVANCYTNNAVTYNWSFVNGTPSSATQKVPGNVTYNQSGTFPINLRVINECGVTDATTNVVVVVPPNVNAGADRSICSGDTIQLGSVPENGMTYRWNLDTLVSDPSISDPTTTLTYNGPAYDTTYSFVVSASPVSNCVRTDTVKVTVRRMPFTVVNPNPAQMCSGTSVQLTASGADTYEWSPAVGLSSTSGSVVTASPASSTSYIVTGSLANGCSTSLPVAVTVFTSPSVAAGNDTVVCNTNQELQLTGLPDGGVWGGSTFITPEGKFNPKAAGVGVYKVQYSAGIGTCFKSDELSISVVSPPITNAGNDVTLCPTNNPVQLTGTPLQGVWSGSPFVTSQGVFTPTTPGRYTLTYTFNNNICIRVDSMVVTVADTISNNLIGGDLHTCIGNSSPAIIGEIPVGGIGAPVYQWQSSPDQFTWSDIPGATAKDYTPGILTQPTWFRRVAGSASCAASKTSTSNPVKIILDPLPVASFNPFITKNCAPFDLTDAIVNLRPDNSVSEYLWFANGDYIGSGLTFPGYVISNADDSVTIKLVVLSKFGCRSDSMVRGFVATGTPAPSFTQTATEGCGPLSIQFTNTTPNINRYNFSWSFGQGQTTTLPQPASISFQPNPNSGDTVYTVTLKAISSCDAVSEVKYVTVRSKPKALFTVSRTQGCSPLKVTFSNNSRGGNTTYTWNFDDGTPSVTSGAASIEHTFTTGLSRSFFVKLVAENECGVDSMVYEIVVNPNPVKIGFNVAGDQLMGCAPYSVKFINSTTGAQSFIWDFGDSTTLNTTRATDTVTHTYSSVGSYVATLTAVSSCNDTSAIKTIVVATKPKVSFTAGPLQLCLNDTVRFFNTSDADVSSAWNFGDGTISTLRNPSKTFNGPGTYRVWLIGSNANGIGCADSNYTDIVVNDTLSGGIKVIDSISSCLPFTTTFYNANSPAAETLWNFGDGSSATGDSVSHTFINIGSYMVSMTSRSNSGCVAKANKLIKVSAPTGTLSYTGNFNCVNEPVRFEIQGNNASQYRFVFDDGDSLTTFEQVVTHQYTSAGTYLPHAYLIDGSCKIKISTGERIRIDKAVAGFTSAAEQNCGITTLRFSDTSTAAFGINEWQWSFGDGTTSSAKNPVKTFTTTGRHNVRVKVIGTSGCSDSVTVPINVIVPGYPQGTIGGDSVVCSNQLVNLAASVISEDSVVSYAWNFGNGISASGRNVTTDYNIAGNYTTRFVATTIYGCTDTVYKTIGVATKPVVNAGPDMSICLGETVQLNASGASTWQWNPLQTLSCSTCPNPIASPRVSTQYVVQGNNGAACSATDTIVVKVNQRFNLNLSEDKFICTGQQVQLSASGGTYYLWNPVAGLSDGSIANPVASPTVTTRYQVIARDDANCFSDTGYVTVSVFNSPSVSAGADMSLCPAGDPVQLKGYPEGGQWSGNFVNGSGLFTPFSPGRFSLVYTYSNVSCTLIDTVVMTVADRVSNNLIGTDIHVCAGSNSPLLTGEVITGGMGQPLYQWQTSTDNINWVNLAGATGKDHSPGTITSQVWFRRIAKTTLCLNDSNASPSVRVIVDPLPVASFNPVINKACAPFNITPEVINLTPDNNVSEYRWFVNNNFIGSGSNFPSYVITNSGDSITVKLVAVSKFGCISDSLSKGFATSPAPSAAFSLTDTVGCGSLTVLITNTTPGSTPYTFQWDFGQGQTSTQRQPGNITFPVNPNSTDTVYAVTMKATSACGNISVVKYVRVRSKPKAAFTINRSQGCSPLKVTFSNLSVGTNTTYTWNFGDGTPPITTSAATVEHTFTTGTVPSYFVKLTARNICGVDSTVYEIVSPVGSLSYTGNYSCINEAIKLEIKGGTASQYRFIFDDGDSLTTTNPVVFHQYTKPGSYQPYAILIDGNCQIRLSNNLPVNIDKTIAGFTSTTKESCGATTIKFVDTSRAYFGLKEWQWNFGDGTTSAERNPTKVYTKNGKYNVALKVLGISGCTDSITLPLNVFVPAFPTGFIAGDTLACTNQLVNLAASVQTEDSVVSYSWNFGNGSTATGRNVTTRYNIAGNYPARFVATTILGCADTVFQTIRVTVKPIVNAGPDMQVCFGDAVQLNATGATTFQWNPIQTLSCSNCPNPVARPAASTQYVVQGNNGISCFATDTIVVNVSPPIKLSVSGNDTMCVDQQVQLFASGASRYLWNPVSGLSNPAIANPIARPAVTTRYQVIARDNGNCFSDTGYVTVAVGKYPVINIGRGGNVVSGTVLSLNPVFMNGPFKKYTWTPAVDLSCTDCARPVATINGDITYKLEVENIYGCTGSDTISYKVQCDEALQLFIPNAFSPDNDGLNDILMVRGRGLSIVKYFRVFNRWGQVIYERSNFNANDPQQGWDGKVNGKPAAPDVYIYTAEILCSGGTTFVKKGNVTLVR